MLEPLVAGRPTVVGVLTEPDFETRVSLTVDTAKQLVSDGYQVLIQQGAGAGSSQFDENYQNIGCTIATQQDTIAKSDVLFCIHAPDDFQGMASKIVISFVSSRLPEGKAIVAKALSANVTLIDLTMVPRITIGQKLDVLSSQGKVAGHRAVVEATAAFGRFHQGEMTAAGKYPPSTTFILGCGVAGLAAIGTARALGSQVKAWDVRPVAKDQVVSMGAKWVTVNFEEDASGAGGYAKESSQEFQKAQQAAFMQELKHTDIAITTAAIPGARAPLLITEEMVKAMKPGSVVVDLAALTGGNCECTEPGKVIQKHGVTIIGYTDLPARMAEQASAMYGQNMVNLLRHIQEKEKGKFVERLYTELDKKDVSGENNGEIIARSVVCCLRGKKNVAPPPPANLGIAPKKKADSKLAPLKKKPNPSRDATVGAIVVGVIIMLILGISTSGKISVLRSFLLAGAAGYQAVWGVAHALHTPLMAVTNAISGLTVVGGVEIFNSMFHLAVENNNVDDQLALALGGLSAAVSTVNIVGGFIVTQRMLNLFKRKDKATGAVVTEDEDWTPVYLLLIPLLCAWSLSDPANNIDVTEALCAVLCIAAIACLSTQKSANLGCKFGIVGVLTGLGTNLIRVAAAQGNDGWTSPVIMCLAGCILLGGCVGCLVGASVSPMKLPQTVAGFHSLVGLAAMTTSVAAFYKTPSRQANMENISALLGNFIGGVTLTGSMIAFAKLNGNMRSKELQLPGKNCLNLMGFAGFIALSVWLCLGGDSAGEAEMGKYIHWGVALLSCLMGLHLVASVGGGDMPVCVTVLNSYSGWALAAEGFNMEKPLLACVGAIIGFSGAILTKIMCDAMNRDIMNVLFGGMNVVAPVKKSDNEPPKVHTETSTAEVAALLRSASKVAIVPGYGMAQARAQQQVGTLAATLRENQCETIFVIHPVAGRMPGQMNVLLAEANVPYDWVKEMDEVNDQMDQMDVTFCIGSNDIVNSAAQELEGCSIWGMPVIEVWKSKKVVFMKRGLAGGYADLENPVFFKENTLMYLGSADKKTEELVQEYKKENQ